MAPVVLETELHCLGCAKKIHKSIQNLLGVERVWASLETGVVVVAGTADAEVLRWRIQQKMRRPVTIVSDGTVAYHYRPDHHHHYEMMHQAPPGRYYGWGTTSSSRRRHHYAPLPPGYPYRGGFPASRPYHHYAPLPADYPYLYGGGYPAACRHCR